MASQPIYLDHAAATPLDPKVLEVMQPYFGEKFYNPSATYAAATDVHRFLETARGKIAHWLGSKPSEIIFTAGGTEANNLAIHGVMKRFPKSNIAVSGIEHESVLAPSHQYDCREVAVQLDGRVDIDNLKQKIDDQTVLVSIMYANNEIGTIQPIRDVAKLIGEIRKKRGHKGLPIYLHTDACQAANYLDLHVARLGVDMMTVNGGKVYGPKQSGAMYLKAGIQLEPLVQGGGQERNLRSGTENVASVVGLAEALDIAQSSRREEAERLQSLQDEFIKGLEGLPGASVNGSRRWRLPNNVHVTFEGKDNERLLIQLDQKGIMAAAGSACSASTDTPSHVLQALGLSDKQAQASLRLTMGRGTSLEMVLKTLETLREILVR